MSRTWSGIATREYKRYKGLKKENLRDSMANTELALDMLAEATATDISVVKQLSRFNESAAVQKSQIVIFSLRLVSIPQISH